VSTVAPVREKEPMLDDHAHVRAIDVGVIPASICRLSAVHRGQIQLLVQQLFLQQENKVRHVGFVPAESPTEIGALCLDAAQVLSELGSGEVALIDADHGMLPIEAQLGGSPAASEPVLPLGPRLWLVPASAWMPDGNGQCVSEEDLTRLREVTTEFDFSILCCPSVPWLISRMGRVCDGMVLVLTANRTRRFAAGKMRNHLRTSGAPVLGTVLTERRFPIPQGLYRSL
jgi:hypothetical protein